MGPSRATTVVFTWTFAVAVTATHAPEWSLMAGRRLLSRADVHPVLPHSKVDALPKVEHDAELIASLPDSFDPRDKWPNCPSLNEIRDQGNCKNSWAFAAVEAMTDRVCIASNGTDQFHFSAFDILTCASDPRKSTCDEGHSTEAWEFWQKNGVVSGGHYNSGDGCKPYPFADCDHTNIEGGNLPPCGSLEPGIFLCSEKCNTDYSKPYTEDKHYGKNVYSIRGEENIKAELFKNGPVQASFMLFSDFKDYSNGVYVQTRGFNEGYRSAKLLGWGEENGLKYWLAANSWNENWGDNGFFKILRGKNHCDIERLVVAGEPATA